MWRPARPRAPSFAGSLRAAIRIRHRVRLRYRGEAGSVTGRTVRPLALTAFSEGWLLVAWCELRADFRTFRLDRVAAATVTGEIFEEEPGRGLGDYLDQRAPTE